MKLFLLLALFPLLLGTTIAQELDDSPSPAPHDEVNTVASADPNTVVNASSTEIPATVDGDNNTGVAHNTTNIETNNTTEAISPSEGLNGTNSNSSAPLGPGEEDEQIGTTVSGNNSSSINQEVLLTNDTGHELNDTSTTEVSNSNSNDTEFQGSGSNITVGDGSSVDSTTGDGEGISIQKQIYIVAGTLGGVVLLLILLVLALAISIASLRSQVRSRHQRYIPEQSPMSQSSPPPRQAEQIHAYDNTAFSGGHEMQERRVDAKSDIERMGFSVYNGKPQENRPTRSQGYIDDADSDEDDYTRDPKA